MTEPAESLAEATVSAPSTPTPRIGLAHAAVLGVISTGAATLSSIVRSKVTARVIGPAGIGITSEMVQIVTLLAVPIGMFTGPALIVALSNARQRGDRAEVHRAYSNAFSTAVVLAVLAGAASVLAGRWVLPEPWGRQAWPLMSLAALQMVLATAAALPVQLLVVHEKLPLVSLVSIATAVISAALVCVGTLLWGLSGQFAAWALGAALVLPLPFWLARRALPGVGWRPRWGFDAGFARDALKLGVTSLIAASTLQFALTGIRVLLERHGGPELNGQFQAAWTIGAIYFAAVMSGLGNVAFPRYASARTADELANEIEQTVGFVYRAAPLVILLAIPLRTPIIRALYDHRFDPAVELLGLMIVGDFAKALAWAYSGPLLFRSRVRAYLATEILGAGGLALGSALLVPRFGLVGVGYAYALNCVAASVHTRWIVARSCDVRVRNRVLMTLAFTAAAALLVRYSHLWFVQACSLLAALLWALATGLLREGVGVVSRRVARVRAKLRPSAPVAPVGEEEAPR